MIKRSLKELTVHTNTDSVMLMDRLIPIAFTCHLYLFTRHHSSLILCSLQHLDNPSQKWLSRALCKSHTRLPVFPSVSTTHALSSSPRACGFAKLQTRKIVVWCLHQNIFFSFLFDIVLVKTQRKWFYGRVLALWYMASL